MENSEILGFQFEPAKTPFSLIEIRGKIVKLAHQQIVNHTLLREMKHQLILGTCVSNAFKC